MTTETVRRGHIGGKTYRVVTTETVATDVAGVTYEVTFDGIIADHDPAGVIAEEWRDLVADALVETAGCPTDTYGPFWDAVEVLAVATWQEWGHLVGWDA